MILIAKKVNDPCRFSVNSNPSWNFFVRQIPSFWNFFSLYGLQLLPNQKGNSFVENFNFQDYERSQNKRKLRFVGQLFQESLNLFPSC